MILRILVNRMLYSWLFAAAAILPVTALAEDKDPAGVERVKGIEYARPGGQAIKLDLYLPKNSEERTYPAVVWIHGGAWRGGDRNFCPMVGMVPNGYVVASIDYRLAPASAYPAQIEDCKAAIRWLRANSEKYRIDPDRIGVIGASAGGHLAALLGTAPDQPELEGDGHIEQTSRVQAVVDLCGPTDLERIADIQWRIDLLTDLLGGPLAQKQELLRLANPITFITPDDPPFLIMHGEKDSVVPVSQSHLLHEALAAAGVESKLHVVPNGEHAFFSAEMIPMIYQFFERHLNSPEAP